MTTAPSIVTVVLNWNGHDDTRANLVSLSRVSYPDHRTVLVDNASTRPGIAGIVEEFRNVHLIENQDNLGFSAGMNVGVRWAIENAADIVVLLNNDTLVDAGFLEPIAELLSSDPTVGAASGTILSYDSAHTDRVWFAGGRLAKIRAEAIRERVGETFVRDQQTLWSRTHFVTGCFLATTVRVIDRVGLLDEDFYFGVEDLDFSWRLNDAGLKLAYVPSSVIWHRAGRSRQYTADEVFRGYISKILLIKKRRRPVTYWTWLAAYSAWTIGREYASPNGHIGAPEFSQLEKRHRRRALRSALARAWTGRLSTKERLQDRPPGGVA
jgi:GT2 family glycosyltransferase